MQMRDLRSSSKRAPRGTPTARRHRAVASAAIRQDATDPVIGSPRRSWPGHFASSVASRAPSVEWRAILGALLDVALPADCLMCGRMSHGGAALCHVCRARLVEPARQRCPRCAAVIDGGGGEACGRCLATPPAYDAALTLGDYAAPCDTLVLALKFGRQLSVASLLGEALAQRVARACQAGAMARPDCVVAVPLGRRRLFSRGYNQSEEIARAVARALALPHRRGLLVRRRETPPQARLPLGARNRNVGGAFALASHARRSDIPYGQHVLLLDDVMTSGATLEAAAQALKRGGVARVTLAVAFRTPR